MKRLAQAMLLALALPAQAQDPVTGRTDGFAMLNDRVGVIVTGLEGVPGAVARAMVGGFVEALGAGGRGVDLLNAGRVIVVRGYPSAVRGEAPGLVIDWRVSIDGGTDIGALYSVIESTADWARVAPDAAAELGREAGAKFLGAHFTAAVIRAGSGGAILLE